jgi:phage-related protein
VGALDFFEYQLRKSSDFGIMILGKHQSSGPQRDLIFISVPGRSGDLTQDNGRFMNYEDTYTIGIAPIEGKSEEEQIAQIRSWLQSSYTYGRLIDSRYPSYYRKAVCTNSVDIQGDLSDFGQASVVFNCKPFRYRIDGDATKTLTAPGILANPEQWESEPYIKISGSGDITIHINDQSLIVKAIGDYIEIDSELQSAHREMQLMNSHLYSEFPVLNRGDNQISWEGSVSKIEIVPRWRAL